MATFARMDWVYLVMFLFGMGAFILSTVSGGGGALVLVPSLSFYFKTDVVAPLIHLANFIGRPSRSLLFWQHIRWDVVKAYLPSALIGGFLGAWLFASMKMEWLQIIIALFLISTAFQFRWGKKKPSFEMRRCYFAPLGFSVCFLSSIVGATGPVLNPFYLNFGVTKESLIATKSVNSFFVAIVQISTYAYFDAIFGVFWGYGIALGLGATAGNLIGKRLLRKVSDKRFRQFVIIMMVISGVVMLVKQLS
ncbi:sulfite exporter TauE/SafE family protein [Halocola ammonii]